MQAEAMKLDKICLFLLKFENGMQKCILNHKNG